MYLIVAVCVVLFLLMAWKRIGRRAAAIAADAPAEEKDLSGAYRRIKDGEAFVQQLDQLGYFKYADTQHLPALRDNMAKEFAPDSELPFTELPGDRHGRSADLRYYSADNETLYEQGGFTDLLRTMQPVFDKMGVAMQVTAHEEVWDHANQ